MRSVSIRLADLAKATIPVGFAGENLHTQVRIDCLKIFEEYPDALATLTVRPPEGEPYPTIVTRDGDEVVWDVTNSDLIHEGKGELQLSFVEDEVVVKSYVGQYRVLKSILPSGEIPDPIDDWITRAEAALADIPHTINEALEEAKESGEFDGFSPIATVTKENKVTTISITDVNGTTTASIKDPEYTDLIDDTTGSGVLDKTWSADKLTTDLAKKEDKPDLLVTYTITGNNTVTCDKTIEEIGQAYDSGKNIEAVIVGDGQRFKAQIFTIKQRDASYLFFVSTTIIFEAVTYIVLLHYSGSETIPVMRTEPMLSANGAYIAQGMKITRLANPTDAADAANKGYVDTAIAGKEDSPFIVTFSITYDNEHGSYPTTCDKTLAEVWNAYNAGKTIKAIATYPDRMATISTELSSISATSFDVNQYTVAFFGKIYDAQGPHDISIVGITFMPGWLTSVYIPSEGIIDDTTGAGITTLTWSADKLTSELDLKAPKANPEFTGSVSLGRKANTTVGQNSVALGLNATASGAVSYAEGINTIASQRGAHAEGVATFANGDSSHAEGNATVANGANSHSEGGGAVASGYAAHAEGMATNSSGDCSHAEGAGTTANGFASHVVGTNNVPDDYTSWVEWVANTSYAVGDKVKRTVTENNETTITGYICKTANSDSSFTSSKWDIDTRLNYVEMVGIGKDTSHKANGRTLDWDGNETISGSFTFNGTLNNGRKVGTTVGYRSIANGTDVEASGYMAYAEGAGTTASGNNSHAEGVSTKATLNNAHAENAATVASGMDSHAEGTMSSAKGYSSHAQNMHTTAVGTASHSEGQNTLAASNYTHAEGVDTVAMGDGTHVEGKGTIANGDYSHVSGRYNIPEQVEAEEWVANTQYDVGDEVKRTVTTTDDIVREYWYVCKTANNDAIFTASKWTKLTLQNYAEIIGNGTADNARSNARTLDWQGNEVLSGDLTIKKGSADEVSVSELAEDVGDLKNAINDINDELDDTVLTITPEWDQTMGISAYGTLGVVMNGSQVSTAIKISKPIEVKKGDIVSITGYLTSRCNIAWMTQDRLNTYQGTPSFIPLSVGSTNGQRTETVTIGRDGYIIVSAFHAYPCSVQITRAYKSQQEENARIAIDSQLRHNYVDTYDFVPNLESKRVNGIFTYSADDKNNSNYIVNAVAYPNGEIIACRSGSGQVVKIANDGTETVLLTIENAQDWRGVFMDSNLNVYVSPHSSQFSPAISNSDRGLYKLPYGGNSFTKVINLCHDVYVTKWTTNTQYAVDDVVFDNLTSIFYVCKTAHTSGSTIDLTKFNTIPAWTKNHAYSIGDLVKYRNIFYRCIYAHTSGSSMNTYTFDALTEYMDNDDTIWTMCEDALGNLYAGVYAHSLRDNPSVYFLQKGATKWFLNHNFIMCGTLPASTYSTAPQHVHCINYNEYDQKLYAAVGETNTVLYSTDRGFTWTDMHIPCVYGQPTYVMGVKDGLLIGSDGHYACGVSKLTTGGQLLKRSGRTAPGFIFNIRRSDVTGWLYAFTRIDNVVGDITKCPPVEAITDSSALDAWKANSNTDPTYLAWWEDYNKWASVYYPEDAIRPQHSVMMVSRDEGETWEVFKTIKCSQNYASICGFITVGYFRDGECLVGCLMPVEDTQNSMAFVQPLVITEGKKKWTADGIDLTGEIFIKTNQSTTIVPDGFTSTTWNVSASEKKNVFYGLAEANSVGSYTADQKTAIKAMIGINDLPAVTSSDNGKIMRVVDGEWDAVALPSANGVSF